MTDSPAALAYSYGLSDAHFSSLSQLQSQLGELGAEPCSELQLFPENWLVLGWLCHPCPKSVGCSHSLSLR